MAEQLVIVQFSRGWSIFVRGQWRGRFDAQVDAVNAALRLLNEVNRTGVEAKLVIQDCFGELRAFDEALPRQDPAYTPAVPTDSAIIN